MSSPLPLSRRAFLAVSGAAVAAAEPRRVVYVIPNFHPASCGWLTHFSKERVYCANGYFDHLDRVRDDPAYSFVLSECNNMIAMANFQPARLEELKGRIREGRVELVNGFFLESTVNLSGGEALVRLGVEGLRWQQAVFGVRPRFAWCIDVCGSHAQMAQITAGLGLEAYVYARRNPTGSAIHWLEAPDGTRVLAIAPGHYADMAPLFQATGPLTAEQIASLNKMLARNTRLTPAGAPVLAFGGYRDYNIAPRRRENPSAFLREWNDPSTEFRFTTLSRYVDEVAPKLKSGAIQIPTLRGGTEYMFHSFWVECPRVKTAFRACEHALQAAEMLGSIASLSARHPYPAEPLYHAWLQLFLNMDRNTLWGAAAEMVFEHPRSWDANDRFLSIAAISSRVASEAGQTLAGPGAGVSLFNPANWTRRDPTVLDAAHVPAGLAAEALPDGRALCRPELPGISISPYAATAAAAAPKPCALPELIETKFYSARIDPRTGALVSLKPKPSGRELLGGAANVVVAEKPTVQDGEQGDFIQFRPARARFASSSDSPVTIRATRGPVALAVTIEGQLGAGSPCTRVVRFYADSPRIDFETTLNDIPDQVAVVAEFPLERDVTEVRRAIPYGFAQGPSKEIVPVVRWSHYAVEGGGLAILDQGLTGRELNGRTPVIYLLRATEKYHAFPTSWLSGKGRNTLRYALLAHDGAWRDARIPHAAWEYNCPPIAIAGRAAAARTFVETSPNVIVESLRREADFLELRLVECLGVAGQAEVKLALPHLSAALTNLVGADPRPLRGPVYRFPIRPQQIVTLRFGTASAVAAVKPLLEWAPLVPPAKRAALHEYSNVKGHPPDGE
jgi:alpha-mannosidase